MLDGDECETEPECSLSFRHHLVFFFLPSLHDTLRKEKKHKEEGLCVVPTAFEVASQRMRWRKGGEFKRFASGWKK